jgi:outer membrane protein assembly factor BamB
VDTDSDQPRGAVWCLNAESGQRQWIYEVPNSVLGTPTLHGVRVYFGCCDGHVYCIRQSDGGFVWKKKIDQRIVSSLVVAADKVYALATSGVLSCLNAGDGAELWRFEELKNSAVNDAYSSPTLANGRLYVAVGGKLYCIGSP